MKGQLKQLITQSSERLHDDSRMHSLKEVAQKPVDNPLLASLNAVAGTKTTTMAVQVRPSDPRNSEKDSNSTTYAKSKMLWVGIICPLTVQAKVFSTTQQKTQNQTLLTYSTSNQLFNLINYCREI